jgi:hypothetical protein
MLDRPDPKLVALVGRWELPDFTADNSWLVERLERFDGPPGMTLAAHNDPQDPLDFYAIILTVPLPNSHNAREIFPVGRIRFSYAAALRDEALLAEEVFDLAVALAEHEVREWFRFDGKHIHDPHPPQMAQPRQKGAHRAKPKSRLREILHV